VIVLTKQKVTLSNQYTALTFLSRSRGFLFFMNRYFLSYLKSKSDGNEWFDVLSKKISEDTGLSYRDQKKCISELCNNKLLRTKLMGIPRRMFFSLEFKEEKNIDHPMFLIDWHGFNENKKVKGVYLIEDFYVGASKNIRNRIVQHLLIAQSGKSKNKLYAKIKDVYKANGIINVTLLSNDPYDEKDMISIYGKEFNLKGNTYCVSYKKMQHG
jgi:hypothetical protein